MTVSNMYGTEGDIVFLLEELLKRAKAGKITGIIYAAQYSDNRTFGEFVLPDTDNTSLLGELAIVQQEVCIEHSIHRDEDLAIFAEEDDSETEAETVKNNENNIVPLIKKDLE